VFLEKVISCGRQLVGSRGATVLHRGASGDFMKGKACFTDTLIPSWGRVGPEGTLGFECSDWSPLGKTGEGGRKSKQQTD